MNKTTVSNFDFPAIVFLVVMFYGEPDIAGALIHWLTR